MRKWGIEEGEAGKTGTIGAIGTAWKNSLKEQTAVGSQQSR